MTLTGTGFDAARTVVRIELGATCTAVGAGVLLTSVSNSGDRRQLVVSNGGAAFPVGAYSVCARYAGSFAAAAGFERVGAVFIRCVLMRERNLCSVYTLLISVRAADVTSFSGTVIRADDAGAMLTLTGAALATTNLVQLQSVGTTCDGSGTSVTSVSSTGSQLVVSIGSVPAANCCVRALALGGRLLLHVCCC